MSTTVKPYAAEGSKRDQVEHMFDRISPKYDLLNRFLSLGTDQNWRRKVICDIRGVIASKPFRSYCQ